MNCPFDSKDCPHPRDGRESDLAGLCGKKHEWRARRNSGVRYIVAGADVAAVVWMAVTAVTTGGYYWVARRSLQLQKSTLPAPKRLRHLPQKDVPARGSTPASRQSRQSVQRRPHGHSFLA